MIGFNPTHILHRDLFCVCPTGLCKIYAHAFVKSRLLLSLASNFAMETESKSRTHHHRKRRERAQKLPPEPSDSEMEQEGMEISPSKGHKDRSRSKPRKKKSSSAYEEDIIDGFAIVSFKSVDDLEVGLLF